MRPRTIVFALVALAIAAATLVSTLTDVHLDGGAVALAVLIGSGVLLLGAGVLAAIREAGR